MTKDQPQVLGYDQKCHIILLNILINFHMAWKMACIDFGARAVGPNFNFIFARPYLLHP